jgi:hypothetical protein
MERGDFSRPIALGDRAVGWVEEEVDAWIYRRIEQKGQARTGLPGKATKHDAPGALLDALNASVNCGTSGSARSVEDAAAQEADVR